MQFIAVVAFATRILHTTNGHYFSLIGFLLLTAVIAAVENAPVSGASATPLWLIIVICIVAAVCLIVLIVCIVKRRRSPARYAGIVQTIICSVTFC